MSSYVCLLSFDIKMLRCSENPLRHPSYFPIFQPQLVTSCISSSVFCEEGSQQLLLSQLEEYTRPSTMENILGLCTLALKIRQCDKIFGSRLHTAAFSLSIPLFLFIPGDFVLGRHLSSSSWRHSPLLTSRRNLSSSSSAGALSTFAFPSLWFVLQSAGCHLQSKLFIPPGLSALISCD